MYNKIIPNEHDTFAPSLKPKKSKHWFQYDNNYFIRDKNLFSSPSASATIALNPSSLLLLFFSPE